MEQTTLGKVMRELQEYFEGSLIPRSRSVLRTPTVIVFYEFHKLSGKTVKNYLYWIELQ